MTSLELKDRRAKLITEMRDIVTKARADGRTTLNSEEEEQWNKRDREVYALGSKIDREIELERPQPRKAAPQSPYAADTLDEFRPAERWVDHTGREIRLLTPKDSFRSTIRGTKGADNLSLGRTLRGLITSDWRGAEAEQRALSSGGTAGFLLSPELSATVIDFARAQSSVLRAGARVFSMVEAEMTLARIENDPVVNWRPEGVKLNEADLTFGAIRLKPKTVGAFIKIPVELAADANNIEQLVSTALTAALGNELDRVLLYGDGALEPKGLRNYIGDADQPILTQDPAAALTDYDDFSLAQQGIKEKNFLANAAIMSPRSWGQLDRSVTGITSDKTPLQPPKSWDELTKFVSSQVLDTFSSTESDAFVGQFNQLLVGFRQQIIVEATRQAGTSFETLEVWVRAYARMDAALARAGAFQIVTGIEA